MKKTSPTNVKINQIKLLSSPKSPRQLFRLNTDNYVIAFLENGTSTFSFHAPILTEVLNDLGGGIRDVTLFEPQDLEHLGNPDNQFFEIRLHLKKRQIVSINSRDHVYLMQPAAYGRMDDETAVLPVCEIWDLADIYPFSHLQITEDLIKVIDPLADDTSPEEVLFGLWLDYQKVTNDRNIQPPISCYTLVAGQHFEFKVTEHPCGKSTLSL